MPRFPLIFCFVAYGLIAQIAAAKVAVIANRTVQPVMVQIQRTGQAAQPLAIPSGDSLPVFFSHGLRVRYGEGLQQEEYPLQASSAYFLSRGPDGSRLQLEQIGLGEQPVTATPAQPIADPKPFAAQQAVTTIEVKVFADDDQPTHRSIWVPKLRQRVKAASEILERQSGIRLKIVEVSTWESDENLTSFIQTLREFERKVKVRPSQLAIGFSSRFEAQRGRQHLGVTRLPLHSHILLRERSRNLLEVERLELLVHELGHYLGASHSPEPLSVMRPVLTRGPQRAVGSRVTFDPVNALLIAIMGEEIRQHRLTDIRKLSEATRKRFKEIYGVLNLAMPRDPAARQYLRMLALTSKRAKQVVAVRRQAGNPLVRDTQQILSELIAFAAQQSLANAESSAEAAETTDELTNWYVRQAAKTASRLRSSNAQRAMLLALGIFLDDTSSLRSLPKVGTFLTQVESDDQHQKRLEVLGKPTMRERTDLTKHFFVSAHLVVALGKEPTAAAGLAKEMQDANGGTGFSFVDMAANRAGITFAERLLEEKLSLRKIAESFHVDDYLPTLRGLDEGLTLEQLEANYGGEGQLTVPQQLEAIEDRVLSLPVYDQ